ncbi:hypothetical protein [Pseudomonas sp. 2835]|uniref:hypothetical protein n=1 Tax=Pseudomonas sp. 2835 TaxID=3156451 RepID=UPI003D1C56F9
MNSVTPLDCEKDYRTSMQLAALSYLQRHKAEHLGDDGTLHDRTTHYLVDNLEVPAFMAPDLVRQAMGMLTPGKCSRLFRLEMDPSCATGVVHLIDIVSGDRAPIPLRVLPHRFQAELATY